MKNLAEIKEKAIAIATPIKIITGGINEREITYTPQVEGKDGYYTVKKSIISFIENGIQYVIPYTLEIDNILFLTGFSIANDIYVPFLNGGFPIEEAEKWTELMLSIF